MNETIKETLQMYINRKQRKERKFNELQLIKESQELTMKQELEFEKLHTEISLLSSFIRDMEYFLELQ